ncbi:tripeptidyl-peptidase I [Malassezia sp. CBS 17886]|nr:tripeptidyl-peptidase I [Malassezia sp. CBS 17886]
MHFTWWTLLVLAFAALARAAPATLDRTGTTDAPHEWERRAAAGDNDEVPLHFALRLSANQSGRIEDELRATSDPCSDRYLQHLSREQVLDMLRPPSASREALAQWLTNRGVNMTNTVESVSGDMLSVRLPVAQARSLLGGAHFSVFQHRSTGEEVVQTTAYKLPRALQDGVAYVGGTTSFARAAPPSRAGRIVNDNFSLTSGSSHPSNMASSDDDNATDVPVECQGESMSLRCLRQYYQTATYQPQAANKTRIGVLGFNDQIPNRADLASFLKEERPDASAQNASFELVTLQGATDNQNASEADHEGNLDMQTVVGMTWPVQSTYYLAGQSSASVQRRSSRPNNMDMNELYAHTAEHLLNLDDDSLPDVLTISYADPEQNTSEEYARRVCTLFAALGLRGVSVVAASGDNGVGGPDDAKCVTEGGHNKTFLNAFPAGCPWVTTVGAVQGFAPQTAASANVSGITSGGGFSRVFERPWYQDEAVVHYITMYQGTRYHGLYNARGRAYPDLAAQGSHFEITTNGHTRLISGTSAAAPVIASIVSLLNDARFAQNKPSLGFLNPLIYQRLADTDAFSDVVNGSSTGCDTDGFKAQRGWDPVTGFGTPTFRSLYEHVLDL